VLKKVIRGGVQRTRKWLQEEEPIAAPIPTPDWAYERLNQVFADLAVSTEHRPHFAWGILYAAHLAKTLGITRISALEFGVAGGNGLLSMEAVSTAVGKLLDVEIDVYGFDTGVGLPKPEDYRDLPNIYRESAFPMDQAKLRSRLTKARLVLGPVDETVGGFLDSVPAPIAFISFDLDYYSSTMHAFRLFEGDGRLLLPRVHCYFDDIMGFTFSEFTGERLAIAEFNRNHLKRKISPIFGLRYFLPRPYDHAVWPDQMYLAHIFDHERYGDFDGLVDKYVGGSLELR
jgi:hypothetical protein